MRKIALLTMPLLILGLFSLAAEEMEMMGPTVNSPVTAEVSGSSTLTWGIDLEENATGFKNEFEADLKITIVPEQSTNTGMMMDTNDLYAYIELNDFKWEVTSADGQGKTTAPGVVTKLFMGPLSIQTHAGPTVKVDYVDPQDKDADDGKGGIKDEDEFPGVDFEDVTTAYTGMGLTVAYDLAPVVLSLGVVSEHDWIEDDEGSKEKLDCHLHGDDPATDKTEGDTHIYSPKEACKKDVVNDINDQNAYAFIGTIALDIGENAALEAKVAYAHEYEKGGYKNADDIGIGAEATFNLGDITPIIAFDTAIPSAGTDVPWDVGGSVKWNLSSDEESHVTTNLMMHQPTEGDSKLYLAMTLKEGDGDAGALEAMGAELTVGLDDAAGAGDWNAKVAASYLVEGIMPYFDVTFGSGDKAKTAFKAGLELTMISHLTTTIEYASKNIEDDKGAVTTAVKISY